MTLNQFANVDAYLIDKGTKRQITKDEYLRRIVTKLGAGRVRMCVPFTERELKEAYIKSTDFSTLHPYYWSQTEIATLFVEAGITDFSLEVTMEDINADERMADALNRARKHQMEIGW